MQIPNQPKTSTTGVEKVFSPFPVQRLIIGGWIQRSERLDLTVAFHSHLSPFLFGRERERANDTNTLFLKL